MIACLRPLSALCLAGLLAACAGSPSSSLGELPRTPQASIDQLLQQASQSAPEQAALLRLSAADQAWRQQDIGRATRILDEVSRRLIPDLSDRIVTQFHYSPADFGTDLNAHLGSAFSLEPLLTQSAWFRVHNRDAEIGNLYFVGAGTHPGAGIPGVVGSAKATAKLMIDAG